MDFQEAWENALRKTEIIRPRVQPLQTFQATRVPYIFLAESALNHGDAVVRKGEVLVEKPSIVLPGNLPQFEGFQAEQPSAFLEDMMTAFFLVRGIRFPSYRYNNKTHTLDVMEGGLQKAIQHYRQELERQENVAAGLVIGPEETWQLSVMVFVCGQVMRSAEGDIQKLLDYYKNH